MGGGLLPLPKNHTPSSRPSALGLGAPMKHPAHALAGVLAAEGAVRKECDEMVGWACVVVTLIGYGAQSALTSPE